MELPDIDWWQLAIAVVAGYLIGSISPATIAAKRAGVDLAHEGSGNPGATNAARTLGRRTGVIVGVLDVLKGLLPAVFFTWAMDAPAAGEAAAFAAVIGHITSPWLHGRGGKGAATALGALLGTHPEWLLWLLPAFAVGYLVFRRVGMGVVVAALMLVGMGVFTIGSARDSRVFAVALGLLVLSRHWQNIARYVMGRRSDDDDLGSPGDVKDSAEER